MTINPANQV